MNTAISCSDMVISGVTSSTVIANCDIFCFVAYFLVSFCEKTLTQETAGKISCVLNQLYFQAHYMTASGLGNDLMFQVKFAHESVLERRLTCHMLDCGQHRLSCIYTWWDNVSGQVTSSGSRVEVKRTTWHNSKHSVLNASVAELRKNKFSEPYTPKWSATYDKFVTSCWWPNIACNWTISVCARSRTTTTSWANARNVCFEVTQS